MPDRSEAKEITIVDLDNATNGPNRHDFGLSKQPPEGASADQYSGPLLPSDYSADMRNRWEAIQTGFVDDPRVSVQQADELVAAAIKKLAESFTGERAKLEDEWSRGNDVSTENLRQALRRYRAFFHRLLSI
jgi:hypothetical protein